MTANESMSADNDDGIELVVLWRMLWRYRFLIGSTTILAGIAAVILALVVTPIYRAEVVLTEVRDGGMSGATSLANQLGGLAGLVGVSLTTGSPNGDARATLESCRLAEEFIKHHSLLDALFEDSREPPTLWLGVLRLRDGVLSIGEDRRRGTLIVAIQWTDPKIVADWANEFVALANELIRTRAIGDSTRNIAYLNKQIERTNVMEVQRVMYNLIETETKNLMLANARLEYACVGCW